MASRRTIESPDRATSGLSSAKQFAYTTGAAYGRHTSATPITSMPSPPIIRMEEIESEPVKVESLQFGRPRFRETLRRAARKNEDILRELSKF